ncbi:nitroreductase [soil metagenome]
MTEAQLVENTIRRRRSIRGFLPRPVDAETLRQIFAVAQRAPSSCNIQPWTVHVVSGATADRVRAALENAASKQMPVSPDITLTGPYEGVHRERQIDSAKQLFRAQGIERHDTDGRFQSYLRNFRFFDAPHAAFIFLQKDLGMREAADCGMYAQTLMLALAARGIASCPQGALSHYAGELRSVLDIPDSHRLLMGIAFGYEDPDHAANAARVDRASVDEAVLFHD